MENNPSMPYYDFTGTHKGKMTVQQPAGKWGLKAVSGARQSGRETITGDTGRARTEAQLKAFRNLGRAVKTPTVKERVAGLWQDAGKRLAQGMVDQFRPIRDLSAKAYALMRLSKGASGAFEVLLKGGVRWRGE